MSRQPAIGLTAGEPAGVGPELCLAVAAREWPCRLAAFGPLEHLRDLAARLSAGVTVRGVDSPGPHRAGELQVMDIPLAAPVAPGRPDPANAPAVLETLRRAAAGCQTGRLDAMVTAPVQKAVLAMPGRPFSGHTEFLADITGGHPVMMLTAGDLRVALATTHLPLSAVPGAITADRLEQVIRVLVTDLRTRFGIARPRVLVAGLNPHAGESGQLGDEEIRVIAPLIRRLVDEGMDLSGPLPADTIFTPSRLENADAVLAMYHDQGLPVLKYAGFGRAVNVTLGLPIIRTSVDHGTALDIAGRGEADPGSLEAALDLALGMAFRRASAG
ncbi:MAG: 4-hydroxythreonine-4-phosphate dehydrogenase PdxA [Gammaproteobacteria bacterium]